MTTEKKVLIINWKWKQFKNEHVNENSFSDEEFAKYTKKIEAGKGLFFEEYQVEPSTLCPDALLVAVSIYKTEDERTQKLLYALIEKYTQPGNRVMVFLHRSNFYDDQDVENLLKKFNQRIAKCFLFAFGRDYIYYSTRRSGLLNDTGGFFRGRDEVTDARVKVFDEKEKLVKQPYFDRVWQYYETEFEIKVFNLKEELFVCWLPFLLPNQEGIITQEELSQAIIKADEQAKGKALFLRLKSFLGKYESESLEAETDFDEKNKLENEIEIIKKLERQQKESYIFDDCIVNLEHDNDNGKYLVKEIYDETKEKLNQLLFAKDASTFNKQTLREVAAAMEELIKVIPGEID